MLRNAKVIGVLGVGELRFYAMGRVVVSRVW